MKNETAKSLFLSAIEEHAPEQWPEFLDDACGGDEPLREEVEKLLRGHRKLGTFHERQGQDIALTSAAPAAESVGDTIGPYKLLEQIGDGGMGVVYMALQKEPVRRTVALKIVKPGMDTKEVIARFAVERQALALMSHPHIAKVLDAGVTESGRPYFVMELVKGIPITEFCDRQSLDTRQRLELFVTVCRAVQHAHQKGVIHRDLKPSNVMVELHDVTPVPKIIDFGVAKAVGRQLTEHTLETGFSQMIGTPLYMSPEQAQLSGLDVDTRSDVYSLGVLLYELLTGTTPFDNNRLKEADFDELRRIIREDEPPKPSERLSTLQAGPLSTLSEHRRIDPRKLVRSYRGELDWIVMRAMEKDRDRRYESASAFADDVGRYLNDEPVEACPPSTWYRLRKYARRNKTGLAFAGTITLTLLLGMGIAAGQAVRATKAERLANQQKRLAQRQEAFARRQQQLAEQSEAEAQRQEAFARQQQQLAEQSEAEAQRQAAFAGQQQQLAEQSEAEAQRSATEAQRNLYLAHMRLVSQDWRAGQIGRLHGMLDSHLPEPDRPDFRGWEWYYFLSQCHQDLFTLRGHKHRIKSVAFSPDEQRLASASFDGTIKIWDVATGHEVLTLRGNNGYVNSVAWSPEEKRLASGHGGGNLNVWDATTGEISLTLRDDKQNGIQFVAWSPDGQFLASANGFCGVKIWDAATGDEVQRLRMPGSVPAWRPDGKQLATAGWDNRVRIWDTATWEIVVTLPGDDGTFVCWSSDGQRLASGDWAGFKIWDAATWEELPTTYPSGPGDVMAWSPDGRRFITKGQRESLKIWDAETEKELRFLRGHTGYLKAAAWSPNGERLATAGDDLTVKLWDVSTKQKPLLTNMHTGTVYSVAWSPDGRHLASAGEDQTVKIQEAATGKEILTFDGHTEVVYSVAWSPDGKFLASASSDKTVKIWDAQTAEVILTIPHNVKYVAWDPDGQRLAGAGSRAVFLWDRITGDELFVLPLREEARDVAWSPDGQQFAFASSGSVQICDAASGKVVRKLASDTWMRGLRGATWSADGRRLASFCHYDSSISIWDVASGKRTVHAKGHVRDVCSLAWSPDDRRLASTGEDETIKIWDTATGQEIVTLYEHLGFHYSVAWSPDGRRLASAGDDGTIKIWDASPGYRIVGTEKKLESQMKQAPKPDDPDTEAEQLGRDQEETARDE